MLVELGLVEQRLMAVREVFDGATVTDVATRNGVTRQTVHNWLRSYANSGVAGLVDKSSKPETCPHQMTPVVEARIVEMRRSHPRWGPRSIRTHLAREGVAPLPGRSSIYRTLVRHHLIVPTPRKRSRSDYKRWERSNSMELLQMDIVGRFYLADGTEVKVVTGVDDHSRYCVCARIVTRATARPVCDALSFAMRQSWVRSPGLRGIQRRLLCGGPRSRRHSPDGRPRSYSSRVSGERHSTDPPLSAVTDSPSLAVGSPRDRRCRKDR
jgi:transposase